MATTHPTYPWILVGTDDPTSVATPAPIGWLYIKTDTGSLYQKVTSGNTGWSLLGGGVSTDASLSGVGTISDPLEVAPGGIDAFNYPVSGPYRPRTAYMVFDDFLTGIPTPGGSTAECLGTATASIMKTANTLFTISFQSGVQGSNGAEQGIADLHMEGANANQFISMTQFRDGGDSGQCINMTKLQGNWEIFTAGRVCFEGVNDFEANMHAYFGFREQIDLSVIGTPEGAWFHPKDNGVQTNWFAYYRISDDTGTHEVDFDTGVRVGFTAQHPFSPRAPQDLLVRFRKHAPLIGGENVFLSMYIDGVPVQSQEFTNPSSQVTNLAALRSDAAAQFQTMYVDWMMLVVNGRPI